MPYKTPEKQRAANRAWYARNKEKRQAQIATWDKAHPEKRREYAATYRENHPESYDANAKREYNADYYAKHGDDMRAKQRVRNAKTYAENPEKVRAATATWEANNPDKANVRHARRRARQRGAGIVEKVNRLTVAENDHWICGICGNPIDPNAKRFLENGKANPAYLHVDHKIPLSKGGDHSYANCQASHASCNQHKSASITD